MKKTQPTKEICDIILTDAALRKTLVYVSGKTETTIRNWAKGQSPELLAYTDIIRKQLDLKPSAIITEEVSITLPYLVH